LHDKEQAFILVVARLPLLFYETRPRGQRQIGNAISPGKFLPGGLPVDDKFHEAAASAEKNRSSSRPEEHLPPRRGHRVVYATSRVQRMREKGGKKEKESIDMILRYVCIGTAERSGPADIANVAKPSRETGISYPCFLHQ